MKTVAVTGAAGKAGRAVVADLLAHDYDVLASDLDAPSEPPGCSFLRADLTDYGQAVEALAGADAVVHLANIPADGLYPPAVTINRNTAMNSNVFLAAAHLKLHRVAWASSETTLGLPFDVDPLFAPIDEAHFPHPTSTYALSKVLGEQTAHHVCEWSGIPFVGLRLSNIFSGADYARVPGFQHHAELRRWNLWGYVDVRDVAQAFRLALEADTHGSQNFIIAAADTIMERPSADLMAEVFPRVRITRELRGNETLLEIGAAADILGYRPEHSWRDNLPNDY